MFLFYQVIVDQCLSMTCDPDIAKYFSYNIETKKHGCILYIHVPPQFKICKVTKECGSKRDEECEFILSPFSALLIENVIHNFEDLGLGVTYTKYDCRIISTLDKCNIVGISTNLIGKSSYESLYKILSPKVFKDRKGDKMVIINDEIIYHGGVPWENKQIFDYIFNYAYAKFDNDTDINNFIDKKIYGLTISGVHLKDVLKV